MLMTVARSMVRRRCGRWAVVAGWGTRRWARLGIIGMGTALGGRSGCREMGLLRVIAFRSQACRSLLLCSVLSSTGEKGRKCSPSRLRCEVMDDDDGRCDGLILCGGRAAFSGAGQRGKSSFNEVDSVAVILMMLSEQDMARWIQCESGYPKRSLLSRGIKGISTRCLDTLADSSLLVHAPRSHASFSLLER